jgi:hypothetical protein
MVPASSRIFKQKLLAYIFARTSKYLLAINKEGNTELLMNVEANRKLCNLINTIKKETLNR